MAGGRRYSIRTWVEEELLHRNLYEQWKEIFHRSLDGGRNEVLHRSLNKRMEEVFYSTRVEGGGIPKDPGWRKEVFHRTLYQKRV